MKIETMQAAILVAQNQPLVVDTVELPARPKILDIGCGKGFLLYDFLKVIPDAEIYGIDSSR